VYFLLHFPWAHTPQALPGALPCGARTFLPDAPPSTHENCAVNTGATVGPTPSGHSTRAKSKVQVSGSNPRLTRYCLVIEDVKNNKKLEEGSKSVVSLLLLVK